MKTYEVVLTKSYIVKIKANGRDDANKFATLFTGDIGDISEPEEQKKYDFKIEGIDCKVSEVYEVNEVYEDY